MMNSVYYKRCKSISLTCCIGAGASPVLQASPGVEHDHRLVLLHPALGTQLRQRGPAIFHEHPDWFRPLFAELERRAIPFVRLSAQHHA